MSRVGAAVRRVGGVLRHVAVWRVAAWLVPAGRRDWVKAIWAEAPEVPPGLRRLVWRAGGARLIAREALLRRRIGGAMLFAVAAAGAAWVAWPGPPAGFATPDDRIYVITMVLLVAGLPPLARPFLGPAGHSRAARFLRVGTYAALLASIPAMSAIEQFAHTLPRGGADLRVYELIQGPPETAPWAPGIILLVMIAMYLAVILWMTSRSRIAPATLAVGTAAGVVLGLVMYVVAPFGLSNEATNPWLPGADIDPLVLLAWLLLLGGPATAAVLADRRYTAAVSSPPPFRARMRQMMAAGLLTSLVGALFVTVAGTGTTAAMLRAAWLRNWLYHGRHLLYGVQNLSSDLRTSPAIAYSHELTGAVDTGVFALVCIAFPLFALVLTAFAAVCRYDGATGQADPRRGGGGPPGPEPAPDRPDGVRPAMTDDDCDLAAGWPGLHEPDPGIEQDRLVDALSG